MQCLLSCPMTLRMAGEQETNGFLVWQHAAARQSGHVMCSPGKVSTWSVDDRVASDCPGSAPARSLEGRSSECTPPLTQQLLAVTLQQVTPYQPWQCGGLLAFQAAAKKVSTADCSDERACVA